MLIKISMRRTWLLLVFSLLQHPHLVPVEFIVGNETRGNGKRVEGLVVHFSSLRDTRGNMKLSQRDENVCCSRRRNCGRLGRASGEMQRKYRQRAGVMHVNLIDSHPAEFLHQTEHRVVWRKSSYKLSASALLWHHFQTSKAKDNN